MKLIVFTIISYLAIGMGVINFHYSFLDRLEKGDQIVLIGIITKNQKRINYKRMNKKIAIPVDEHNILDAHFGHCKFFVLFDVENKTIIANEKVVPPPHEPGLLPKWLSEKGVSDIVAGGMGQKAIQLFNQYGVNAFVGAPKLNAERLVDGFLNGGLNFTANYCDH